MLAVFNICGLSGQENTSAYIDHIRSLISQTIYKRAEMKIAVSACCNGEYTKQKFSEYLGKQVSYNWIEEPLPVSVTFNDTVQKCVGAFGPFDGYLYIDSGISFWDPSNRYDAVDILFDSFAQHDHAVLAAFPSNDDGSPWWGILYEKDKDFRFPVGKATNLHCQIFPEKWRVQYGRILPDIFASNCMESIFSCQAAAIDTKYVITQKVMVQHLHSMDGASMSARAPNPNHFSMSQHFVTPGKFFKHKKSIDEKYMEGYHLGFGFEECAEWWKHDPRKFGADGFALDTKLLTFLKRELYLTPDEFDYSKIRANFIAAKQ